MRNTKGGFMKGWTDETQHESDGTLECVPTKLKSSEMQRVWLYEEHSLYGRQPARSFVSSEASQPSSWTPTRCENTSMLLSSWLPSTLEMLSRKLMCIFMCQLEAAAVVVWLTSSEGNVYIPLWRRLSAHWRLLHLYMESQFSPPIFPLPKYFHVLLGFEELFCSNQT